MQLANPIWLWGLSGMLIPIGIHLLSRKEGRVIRIGSVRHLEDTVSKQFKSIRLNEYILLGLRCLLIIILVLLLAGLGLNISGNNGKWLLIESGLDKDNKFSSLIDSLKKKGYEPKLLADGFPDLKNASGRKKVDYWNLINQLETISVEQAVVLSYNYLEGFKGKRSVLPPNVRWISKVSDPTKFAVRAVRISKDSIVLREGSSYAGKTNFSSVRIRVPSDQNIVESENSDSVQIEFPDSISIAIVNDSSFVRDAAILVAALKAIDNKSPDAFKVERFSTKTYSPKHSDWIVWLSERPPSRSKNQNMIYYQHRDSEKLLDQIENSTWILTVRLNEEIALRENIAVKLALILNPRRKDKIIVNQFDQRALQEKELWSFNSSTDYNEQAGISSGHVEKYLLALFLLVLVIERWIAFKRKQ